jgi:hypothetical protein
MATEAEIQRRREEYLQLAGPPQRMSGAVVRKAIARSA